MKLILIILISLQSLVVCAQKQQRENVLSLGYDHLFPTKPDITSGDGFFRGTFNQALSLNYQQDVFTKGNFRIEAGLAGEVFLLLSTYYDFTHPDATFPKEITKRPPSYAREDVVTLGIPVQALHSFQVNERNTLRPFFGVVPFTLLFSQDWFNQRQYSFELEEDVIVYDINYKNGIEEEDSGNFAIVSAPKFKLQSGVHYDYEHPRNEKLRLRASLLYTQSFKDVDKSDFVAFGYDPELRTEGSLIINRNALGVRLGYRF